MLSVSGASPTAGPGTEVGHAGRGWEDTGWDAGATVVEVHQLAKSYGSVSALDGVSLEVRAGEVLGLLGPNGAGKTTLLETVLGLRRPDAGYVRVLGLDPWADASAVRNLAALQPQTASLFANLTVRETLRLWTSFYPRPRPVEELVERLGLGSKADARVKSLSGGQERRLLLAVALAGDVPLVFLDEPTGALDPQARRHVWGIITSHVDRGGSICLSTHSMEEAATVCHRVCVLDHGRILAQGAPRELVERYAAGSVVRVRFHRAPSLEDCRALPGVTVASSSAGAPGSFEVTLSTTTSDATVRGLLAMDGCAPDSLVVQPGTLEDVFLTLTGRELRDEEAA